MAGRRSRGRRTETVTTESTKTKKKQNGCYGGKRKRDKTSKREQNPSNQISNTINDNKSYQDSNRPSKTLDYSHFESNSISGNNNPNLLQVSNGNAHINTKMDNNSVTGNREFRNSTALPPSNSNFNNNSKYTKREENYNMKLDNVDSGSNNRHSLLPVPTAPENSHFNNDTKRREENNNTQLGSHDYNPSVNRTVVTENIERTIIHRNPVSTSAIDRPSRSEIYTTSKDRTSNQSFRASIRSSRPQYDSFKQSKNTRTKAQYDITDFYQSFGKSAVPKNDSNSVTVERYVTLSNHPSLNKKQKGLIPMLKTNKAYDISFTLDSTPIKNSSKNSWRKSEKTEIETIEYSHQRNDKSEPSVKQKREIKTIDRLSQTETPLTSESKKSSMVQFENLMKDVNFNVKSDQEKNERIYDRTDGGRNEGAFRMESGMGNENNYRVGNMNKTETTYGQGNGNQTYGTYGMETRRINEGNYGGKNLNISEVIYSGNSLGGNISTAEINQTKEWMIVEYPDGHQEKREFRKQTNEDGDVNYIDVLNGNILKTEKAPWKCGEEWIKNDKGISKIRYEWRNDPTTNTWIKYNADNNEILKRGDWKTGTEWRRNSKGKLEERTYKYSQNADGKWVKVDYNSGKIIDYSTSSVMTGYDWVPSGKHSRKKLKDRRWKKQEYKYVENNKGMWEKRNQETNKVIGKPTKKGWKEGIDYHMDKDGKVKKVVFVWESKDNGVLEKVDRKTKEPINSSWKEGREILMRDDVVNTTDFAWIPIGRDKWVKINKESGAPITNEIKTSDISKQNLPNMTNRKSIVTKTTKRVDNDKIVEENMKIEQNDGGVIKNTTKTTQFVK